MEQGKGKSGTVAIIAVIVIVIAALAVLFATGTISLKSGDTKNENGNINGTQNLENEKENAGQEEFGSKDTFNASTNSGIVEVLGYPVKTEKNDMNGTKYNYVYFYILKTKNAAFKDFIFSMKGNSYVSDNAIGLGCIKNDKLHYSNASDKYGMLEYELSEDITAEIMNATFEKPIELKLERLLYTSGTDAPICYSHITNINLNK